MSPKPSQDDQKSSDEGSWERLGRLLGQLGGISSALEDVLEVLERSWGHLAWNLRHLGRVLERLRGVLGGSWGAPGPHFWRF